MNIFKWLMSRSGKMALSAAQVVGLSAVVGVAGIAAWQYLDSPTDNTSFNLGGQYNSGEVVYVAGSTGGSYGANGEMQSSFMATPSKAIEMTEKMTLAQQRAEEYEESSDSSFAPPDPQAYQMGGTEGLGLGGNRANEADLKNNPMAMMQMIAPSANQMYPQMMGQQTPAATLASASRDWGSSAAKQSLSGGGGSGGSGSSFVVQNSGKGGQGASGKMENPADIMKNFQAQVASAQEGARLRARASFGNDMLGENRDAWIEDARTSKERGDLDFIRKRSADAARNKNRAANEASRAFLASTKISGGMTVTGDNVTTGQGQSSKDFDSTPEGNMQGVSSNLGNFVGELDTKALERKKARDEIRTWVWIAIPTALAAMVAIPAAIHSTGWIFGVGWALAAAIAAIALVPVVMLGVLSLNYAKDYGGSSLSTWGGVVSLILTACIGISFIPAVGFAAKWAAWAQLLLAGGFAGLGGLSAWWVNSGTESKTLDSEDLNINDNGDKNGES